MQTTLMELLAAASNQALPPLHAKILSWLTRDMTHWAINEVVEIFH